MTEETKKELIGMRKRLIVIRDEALYPSTFDASIAVGLSNAIRSLHFAIEGEVEVEAT